jgi:hypothetical protein
MAASTDDAMLKKGGIQDSRRTAARITIAASASSGGRVVGRAIPHSGPVARNERLKGS